MLNSYILTATEINSRAKNINKIINDELLTYIKKRVKSALITNKIPKSEVDSKKLEYFNEFSNDETTNNMKLVITERVKQQVENYNVIRNELDNLNEISYHEIDIEKTGYQNYDKLNNYEEILKGHIINNSFFKSLYMIISEHQKENIDKYIKTYKDINLNFKRNYNNLFDENNPKDILVKMHQLYRTPKDIDDIELYDMYNGFNNIDLSNLLSDILFKYPETELIEQQKTNISKFIEHKIISSKLLGCLLRNTTQRFTVHQPEYPLVTNNSITCFDTMYINNDNNKKLYTTRTIGELLLEITNPDLSNIAKEDRIQIYTSTNGKRPKATDYDTWSGLQIFDIDLKDFVKNGGNIIKLKKYLFENLMNYHWLLWVCLSSSGKGIHIYTKVSPPINPFINSSKTITLNGDTIPYAKHKNNIFSKYWYQINYYHKASIIYDLLNRGRTDFGFKDDDFVKPLEDSSYNTGFELKGLDNTVGRITSGIRLTYDKNVLVNENFLDLPIQVDFTLTTKGYDNTEFLHKCFLRKTKISENFFKILNETILEFINIDNDKIEESNKVNIDSLVLKGYDTTKIKEIPLEQIKYKLRYEVCNTLAALYGKDGLNLAHQLLRSKECGNVNEINSFYSSALRNKKEASKYGIDILTKCGIVSSVQSEFVEELVDKYKLFLKKQIEKSLVVDDKNYQLVLNDDEYIGMRFNEVTNKLLKQDKINLLYAPPAVGKTEYVKQLAKKKRVMLVLPFISVIENKIENDKDIMNIFECFYDNKDISKLEYGINAVTTFDKFSKANYEKISRMFDYIVIDEEHLLFNSQYRISTTASAIRNIKKLFYITSNDPFSAKIILMTGTPTGSDFFFAKQANIINVYKKLHLKTLEFHICDDNLDAITRLSYKVSELLNDGTRIIIPTNKGDIYIEKIVGMVKFLLQRDVKYGYYKRSNKEQEICININEYNSVMDYEIIFCSNYLSVGIDINDVSIKFAVCYLGAWSAYEIEQFNSRIRRQDIKSYYFIQTLNYDGKFNDLLYEEPKFQLKLTDDDITHFNDDKAIANKKEEFIAQYDPVLHTITTPGFVVVGKQVKFDKEQYELINFENKYNECYQHPLKIASVLYSYGYDIVVSTEFEGLSNELQQTLKEISIESAKEERLDKNRILLGTTIDLIKINNYISPQTKLEFHNVVEWIIKNKYDIIEDRNLDVNENKFVKVEFNMFAQPETVKVKSRVAVDKIISTVHYLVNRYSTNKTLEIVNRYVDDSGILVQKKFMRAVNLLKLMESHYNNELSTPIEKLIEKIYEFVDLFEADETLSISYNKYTDFVDLLTNEYIDYLGVNIKTKYGWDKLRETVQSLFNDIATRISTGKKMLRFEYNKLPDQDGTAILNRRSVDALIEKIFKITDELITNSKRINPRNKHIEIVDQPF